MTAPTATRLIYAFDEGSREMRDLLGGKGANVAVADGHLSGVMTGRPFSMASSGTLDRSPQAPPDESPAHRKGNA